MTARKHGETDDRPPDRFDSYLLAYEEAKSRGQSPESAPPQDADSEETGRYERARECIDLMHRVWSSPERAGQDDTNPPDETPPYATGAAAWTADDELPHRIGRFLIDGELGRGGFGIVFRAHDPSLGREVALKVPRPEALLSSTLTQRFLREAETAAQLHHPHIVTVYEVGQDGPVCYIASEICPGPTLAQWLYGQTTPPAPRLAAEIALVLAEAISHSHSHGVLHRDIKPSNVLLSPATSAATGAIRVEADVYFVPKLTDFGVAKLMEGTGDETRTGAIIGTPRYMSPEQAEGRIPELDARTDVYALGVVLYEMLAGQPPFVGNNDTDTLRRIVSEEPVSLRTHRQEIPRDLEAICHKCLEKSAKRRYATAHEVVRELGRFLSGIPTEARPVSGPERVVRWARRKPALSLLIAVTATAAVLLFATMAWYSARLSRSLAELRQYTYASDMRIAFDSWQHDDLTGATARLDQYSPIAETGDLRSFPWHFLHARCFGNSRQLAGPGGALYQVILDPNGGWIAAAGQAGVVRLWDAGFDAPPYDFAAHDNEINCLTVSPDGSLLVTGSDDGTVRVWHVTKSSHKATNSKPASAWSVTLERVLAPHVPSSYATPEQAAGAVGNAGERTPHGNVSPIYGLAFSADGQRLATAGQAGLIHLWRVDSWKPEPEPFDQGGTIDDLKFSPTGAHLVSTGRGASLVVWDLETRKRHIDWHADPKEFLRVTTTAFSSDGRTIAATAGNGSSMHLIDCRSGIRTASVGPFPDKIHSVSFIDDDTKVVAGLKDGTLRIWNLLTGLVEPIIKAHPTRIWDVALSANGRMLATASEEGAVKLWDIEHVLRQTEHWLMRSGVGQLCYTTDGKHLAAMDGQGNVRVWNALNGRVEFEALGNATLHVNHGEGRRLALSPDGRHLAAVNDGQTVTVWDWRDGQAVRTIAEPAMSLAYSPDGQILASGGEGFLRLHSVTQNRTTIDLRCAGQEITSIAFTNEGDLVVAGSSTAGQVGVWDVVSQKNLVTVDEIVRSCKSLAVSPVEPVLAVADESHEIRLFDLRTGKPLPGTFSGHTDDVLSLSFSPDGSSLASASFDGRVILWDRRTSQKIAELDDVGGYVWSVAFSPDGRALAAGGTGGPDRGDTGVVCLWRTESPPAIDNRPGSDSIESHSVDHGISVYSNDFDRPPVTADGVRANLTGAGTKEPANRFGECGHGTRRIAGNLFRNATTDATSLTLTGLPPHGAIGIRFVLAIIDRWDGIYIDNQATDAFVVRVAGHDVFHQSFSNGRGVGNLQQFVPDRGSCLHAWRRGNLGYNTWSDAVYDMSTVTSLKTIQHRGESVTIDWSGAWSNYEGGDNESWAIDNVEIVLHP